MIDANEIIAKQLGISQATDASFDEGYGTRLVPARYVPQLSDEKMRLPLNGTWRATRWPFRKNEAKLAVPNLDDAKWEAVEQPGRVFYNDPEENPATVKDWDRVKLTHIDPDDGAMLRRTVRIPGGWRGKRVYLRFDAVYPACRIYLDGELLGEHLSGLTPVEFDVTGKAKPGKDATVAVRLIRRHKHVRLDMPRHSMEFAGISQDAYFHATGQCQIADYHLITSLDKSLKSGKLEGEVRLRNTGKSACTCKLKIELFGPDGRRAASSTKSATLPPGERKAVPVSLAVKNPALWNDEFPNLYRVTLTLAAGADPRVRYVGADGVRPRAHAVCPYMADQQQVAFRTGFRRFDLAGQRPVLNGNPVKFRGVNHLTFNLEGGMCNSEQWLRQCLTLMKKANVNCIRTHYLGPKALAGLCDELGIYLVQELPIDWGTDYVQDPETVGPVLMRMEGGIRRDRHHPSVMLWSIGNENMPGTAQAHDDFYNHLRIYEQFAKTLDPSRPTMFPPPGPAGEKVRGILELRLGDIADTHYSFSLIKQLNEKGVVTNPETWDGMTSTMTRDEALARGWSGVWFSSEYGINNLIPDLLNAPYTSIISDLREDGLSGKNSMQVFIDRLRFEWDYMRDDPHCLGGAYFPWLCASAADVHHGPWGWNRWGEDGDWGIVASDLTPKPYFWAMRVIFSPIQFPARITWKAGDTEFALDVKNGYNSIDLKDCILRTQIGGSCLREWQDFRVACQPGQSAIIRIPAWNKGARESLDKGKWTILRLHVIDPSGYRPITADVIVVPEKKE